jgi:hypothetical protein
LKLLSESHQIGERCSLHLVHDLAAMNLERDFTDAQLCGGLLVEKTADYQGQDFSLTGSET